MKKINRLFFAKFIFFLFGFAQVYAEYVFFEHDRGENRPIVDVQKHKDIYEILMRFQFPMSFNPVLKQVSGAEKELLDRDEKAFLEKKLEKLDPKLRLIFVPRTIYELFFIRRYLREKGGASYLTQNGRFYKDYDVLRVFSELERAGESVEFNRSRFWGLQDKINRRASLREEHRSVNEALFYFIENNLGINNLNEKKSLILAKKLLFDLRVLIKLRYEGLKRANSYFKRNVKEQNVLQYSIEPLGEISKLKRDFYIWWYLKKSRSFLLRLLRKAISLEWNAFKTGKFVLYRGTSTSMQEVDGEMFELVGSRLRYYKFVTGPDDGIWDWNAISFSMSMFSGFFTDLGACSYFYFLYQKIGYGLSVDKSDMRKDHFKRIFYMPALNSIALLCGRGEFFHPRTKIYTHSRRTGPISYADEKFYDSSELKWKEELSWSKFLRKNFALVCSNVGSKTSIFNFLHYKLSGGLQKLQKRLKQNHLSYEKKIANQHNFKK